MLDVENLQRSIDALVDLIPAKSYVVASGSQDDETSGPRDKKQLSTHNAKKQIAPKQRVKEATKKARKWKLDPESDAQTSTTSVQKAAAEAATPAAATIAVMQTTTASSISDLRDKVKERIADMKRQRGMAVEENRAKQMDKADGTAAPATAATGKKLPTPRSRQEILEKRLKKRNERKEEVLKKKKGEGIMGANAGSKDVAARLGKAALGEDIMDFSRLQFDKSNGKGGRPSTTNAQGMTNKQHRLNKKQHDPKSLLAKLQSDATKLTELSTKNPEKHAAILEKAKWDKASAMATGEVVRDDIKLVKKTVKRLEKKKVKSHNDWKHRKDSVTKSISDRDKKREANLKNRSEGKKMGVKKGSGVKKGGSGGGGAKKRAGFEGGARRK
ncbi:hypothetical protein HDU98_002008 [Podochytrium sp. JEL0797]|nr:hypothetical protein HDU98_002008 [Podochytrium sp. JEL0797]